jgi:hypothetical protein
MRAAIRRRLPAFTMLLVLAITLTGVPANAPSAQADELSDAKARQEQLKKDVAAQKARVAALNSRAWPRSTPCSRSCRPRSPAPASN